MTLEHPLRRTVAIYGGIALVTCTGLLWANAHASPQDSEVQSTETLPTDISENADRILREMGEYLSAATEFTFHTEVAYDSVLPHGQKVQYGGAADIVVQRPDRLRVTYDGDERKSRVYYDGKTITLHDAIDNVYAVAEVPSTIDDALDVFFDQFGFTVPIADLVYADPYGILIENAITGMVSGLHPVDGVPCHHLIFEQETIDWQIWIEDGPRPVPRKLLITYKLEPESPQYVAELSGWNFQPGLSGHYFEFHPPEGSDDIEFLPLEQSETSP